MSAASHEVFISYARKDERVADAIHRALQGRQIECWIDRQEIKPGFTWSQEIVKAIDASKLMVLVFSGHVNKSHVIPAEVHQAFSRQIPIIVVRIAAVEPDAALRLELSRSQWLDARPFTKHALKSVVNSVEHLLHNAEPLLVAPSIGERYLKMTVQFVDMLMGRRGYGAVSSSRVPEASPPRPTADGETIDTLVRQKRWYAIKELIDRREAKGVPLRDLAQLKPVLVKRLDTFERGRTRALAHMEHIGPEAVEDDLAKLELVIADHPGLDELKAMSVQVREQLADLRRVLDRCAREERWVAAENEIRNVAHRCRLATQSLLRAAETASTKSEQILNRFDLTTWSVLVGILVVVCASLAQHVFLGSGGAGDLSSALAPLVAFLAVAVVPTICLGLYGRKPSAASIVLAPLFAIVAGILHLLVQHVLGEINDRHLSEWAPVVCEVTCAVLTLLMMLMPTADLVSTKMKPPSFVATLCACAAAGIQMPDMASYHRVTTYLPAALVTSTLLAVTGSIRSRRAWLALPSAALLAGYAKHRANLDAWAEVLPVLSVALFFVVIAAFFCGGNARRSFLWVLLATAAGFLINWLCLNRSGDEARSPSPAILVSLWAAAVGSAAFSYKSRLGHLQIIDCLRKRVSERVAFAGTRVTESRLTDTEWYRAGIAWHTKRDRRERSTPPDAGVAAP